MLLLAVTACDTSDVTTGEVKSTGLPSSNVIYYDLSDHAWACIRPSGTEPKIKIYFGVVGNSIENANEVSKKFVEDVMAVINPIIEA